MKTLNDTFNIEDVPTVTGEVITQSGQVIVPEANTLEEKVDYDYEKTRDNLHSLLAHGQEALIHALDVAKQSEHPRAFEVVGNLVKQLADVNHQLLDLSEKRQKISGKDKEQDQPTKTVNNAIFVGSTTELNKMLHHMIKGE